MKFRAVLPLAFLVVLLAVQIGKTNPITGTVHLYLNDTSSLGVQVWEDLTVIFTITNGTLNSSTTQVYNKAFSRGYLRFNSSSINTMRINFDSDLAVNVNGVDIENGDAFIFAAYGSNLIQWYNVFYPFLPALFLFGMVGLGSMFVGVLWPIALVKEKKYYEAGIRFVTFFFIGLGLFMGWVFL